MPPMSTALQSSTKDLEPQSENQAKANVVKRYD